MTLRSQLLKVRLFEIASKVFGPADDINKKRVQQVHAASLISLDLGRLITGRPQPFGTLPFLYYFFNRFKHIIIIRSSGFLQSNNSPIPSQRGDLSREEKRRALLPSSNKWLSCSCKLFDKLATKT